MVKVQRADSMIEGELAVELFEGRFKDTILLAASFKAPLRNAPAGWCSVFEPKPKKPMPVRSGRR